MHTFLQLEPYFDKKNILMLREYKKYKYVEKKALDSPHKIFNIARETIYEYKPIREKLYVFALNIKLIPACLFEVSSGNESGSIVSIPNILRFMLLTGHTRFILVHNHPSGSLKPSNEDISVTKQINKASELIGIELLDHIIVGDNEYTSMRMEGII